MIVTFDSYYIDSIQEKDAWNLCDLMIANELRFKKYFPSTLAQNLTPELAKQFTSLKVKQYKDKEEFLFTIKQCESNTLIGLVYIKDVDWNKNQGEFAYCVGYQHEGRGIIHKSVKELSKYAFEKLGLETLQIIVNKLNIPSVKVAEKNEFIWIKTLLNEFTPPNSDPMDMELYELKSN